MREEIAESRRSEDNQASVFDEDHPAFRESLAARVEIAQMVKMIGRAKLEIAAIKHPSSQDDRMQLAASELDAIVVATETSTQDVLAASEQIEAYVRKLAALHPEDVELVTLGDQIANEIIKTIRFIEEKILAIINIWGMEAFMDLPMPSESSAYGEDSLMNGPQLENQGITQDEINALFD